MTVEITLRPVVLESIPSLYSATTSLAPKQNLKSAPSSLVNHQRESVLKGTHGTILIPDGSMVMEESLTVIRPT